MPDPQNFLDNLENLRLVMSVALEYFLQNRNAFVQTAKPAETRRAETSIAQIRSLAQQLSQELTSLEALLAKPRSN